MRKMIFYMASDCENCEEAKAVVSELGAEHKMEVLEKDVTNIPSEHVDVPTVCIVNEEGKEECVIGFADKETFREELKRLIGKKTVV